MPTETDGNHKGQRTRRVLHLGYLAAVHAFLLCLCVPRANAQGVDVSTRVVFQPGANKLHSTKVDLSGVVVWLTPVQPMAPPVPSSKAAPNFTLVQKNKQFSPHLLVIPTGTSVEFPNLDPFFHNVFSLFNGKKFDLGLYEAGSRRWVRFDREGVSYIFCNIHPEMGAVIVSLATPYYAESTSDGVITIRGVPPGIYLLKIWAEKAQALDIPIGEQRIQVTNTNVQLPTLHLFETGTPMKDHKNKFGEEYKNVAPQPY
jgi:plastocyanin